jgi:hypothetical protein
LHIIAALAFWNAMGERKCGQVTPSAG